MPTSGSNVSSHKSGGCFTTGRGVGASDAGGIETGAADGEFGEFSRSSSLTVPGAYSRNATAKGAI